MIDSTYIDAGRVRSTNQAHSTFAMPAYIAVDIIIKDPATRTDMVLLDGPAFDPAKPAG